LRNEDARHVLRDDTVLQVYVKLGLARLQDCKTA
jgi:hypothetical protein